MHQHRIKKIIQGLHNTAFMFVLIFLFDKNIPHTADHPAARLRFAADGLNDRIKLKSKCLAPEWIQFQKKYIRHFPLNNGQQFFLPFFLDLIQRCGLIRTKESLKFRIHLQPGKMNHFNVAGNFCVDPGPAGYQQNLMAF